MFHIKELPAVRRTQPITKKAKISSTTPCPLLQWLHGKQQLQQQVRIMIRLSALDGFGFGLALLDIATLRILCYISLKVKKYVTSLYCL